MKQFLAAVLALLLCLPVIPARAWDEQNNIQVENLPIETLYVLEGQSFVQAIQEHPYLFILTEDGGRWRTITIFHNENGAYVPDWVSAKLPAIGSIKPSIVATPQSLTICYSEALLYAFQLTSYNGWDLRTVSSRHTYRVTRFRLIDLEPGQTRTIAGNIPARDIRLFDPNAFPPDFEQAAEALYTEGYALVHNPDPADRLNLRASASAKAMSKGRYYNGTPVYIAEDLGEWVKVFIANEQGYMMKKYLAFGSDMLQVQPAFPSMLIKESLAGKDLAVYQLPDSTCHVNGILSDTGRGYPGITILGAVGRCWYHVICENGNTGYMPVENFTPGNG